MTIGVDRNVYRRSLVRPQRDMRFLARRSRMCEAVRKDFAVHVSLSSDSVVKQPGDRAIPLPGGTGEPPKPKTSERSSDVWSPLSVRCFAGAPSRRSKRRAVCGRYIVGGSQTCQPSNSQNFHRSKRCGRLWKACRKAPYPAPGRQGQNAMSHMPIRHAADAPRRTGATFPPPSSHRGKASDHSSNREYPASSLTRWRQRAIVVEALALEDSPL
jgi:hypothetical protein